MNLHQRPKRHDDEIDLYDLIQLLWKGRRLVVIMFIVGLALASLYASTVQERWTSRAHVSAPGIVQVKGLLSLQRQIESITKDEIKALNDLPNVLFNEFIVQVDLPENQIGFLLNQGAELGEMGGLFDIKNPKWQDTNPFFTVSFTGSDANAAREVLSDYLALANQTVVNAFYRDLEDQVAIYSRALNAEKNAIVSRIESERAGRSIDLSSYAEVASVVPVRYHEIENQLQILRGWNGLEAADVSAYRYQLEPTVPSRSSSSMALLLVLGGVLGLMLGVFAVLGINAVQTRAETTLVPHL